MTTIVKCFAVAALGLLFATGCSHSSSNAGYTPDGSEESTASSSSIYICPPGCVHACASEKVARLPECVHNKK